MEQTLAEKLNKFKEHLRDDIVHLLHIFNQKSSFRYEEFAKVWNELKFYQLLTTYHYYPLLYRDLIKDALKLSLEHLCDDLDLEVRTGALYLLYGIYFLQVEKPKLKIIVDLEQWKNILEFIATIASDDNLDIEYTFRCLLHSDAFEFCATSQEIKGITNQYVAQRPRKKSEPKINTDAILRDFKKELAEDPLINELKNFHEAYIHMKNDLVAMSNNNMPVKALSAITQDLDELLCLKIKKQDNESDDEVEEESEEEEIEMDEIFEEKPNVKEDSVLDRRQRIKSKAAKMGTT